MDLYIVLRKQALAVIFQTNSNVELSEIELGIIEVP